MPTPELKGILARFRDSLRFGESNPVLSRLTYSLTLAVKGCRRILVNVRSRLLSIFDEIEGIVASSATIPGWVDGEEARQIAKKSLALNNDPTIVEVGVFMGRSTVLLAGPRRLRGSGKIHCIDAFDCSGDAFSIPHYQKALKTTGANSLEDVFRRNMARLKLDSWIVVHKGSSRSVASQWRQPIDLLLLDGDHSPEGAREAFDDWVPFLKAGGTLILRNTRDRVYSDGHDGNRRLAVEVVLPPRFCAVQLDDTTFAVKNV